ncbi:MAG: hypothetical protein V4525_13565 [Pseudomonadota bacterium]
MAGACQSYPLTSFHKELLAVTTPHTFSKDCVEYGMNVTLKSLAKTDHQFFSSCSSPAGFPKPSNVPVCVTEDYVNVTQKSIEVIGDCLELPIKEILPKLKGESGFFHNALGRGYDAGIGQMTKGAIIDAKRHMKVLKEHVWRKAPTNASCQFIKNHWDELTKVTSASVENRCELTSWPLNPFKNFLWFGSYFLWLRKLVENEYDYKKIKNKIPNINHKALKNILANVAYNTGPNQIINVLSDFLDKRKKSGKTVTKEDFNFKSDLGWINLVKPELWKSIPIQSLTFPGYVKIYLNLGHPGYLPDLMKQIYNYNNVLGENTCTPNKIEGYLAI